MMKRFISIVCFIVLFGCGGSAYPATYNSATMVNVMDNGAVGDGVANDASAIDNAYATALAAGKDVYFPDGTYLYSKLSDSDLHTIRLIGQSKTGTIILDNNWTYVRNITGADDLTFKNFRIADGFVGTSRIFRNVRFEVTGDTTYLMYTGYYTEGQYFTFENCDFIHPAGMYSALWLRKYSGVIIKNCTFPNGAYHGIRLAEPYIADPKIEITGNTVTGGTTGIFIGSDRVYIHKNGLIEGNILYRQEEESIAMDGFGNNEGLVPVIANGPISSVANDNNGRLVIGMDNMVYVTGAAPASSPVSLRNDWTNFYFTLGQGTGQEGTMAKIYSYDNVANTLTLDLYTLAASVTIGGDGGVQGGFFNWTIRGNRIFGKGGSDTVAISAYLNVFGTRIENNFVSGCARGVLVAGGLMLSTYYTLAWNNIVSGNEFITTDGASYESIQFTSLYDGRRQYGNKFINNTMIGGTMKFENQSDFVYEGNSLRNVTTKVVWR